MPRAPHSQRCATQAVVSSRELPRLRCRDQGPRGALLALPPLAAASQRAATDRRNGSSGLCSKCFREAQAREARELAAVAPPQPLETTIPAPEDIAAVVASPVCLPEPEPTPAPSSSSPEATDATPPPSKPSTRCKVRACGHCGA